MKCTSNFEKYNKDLSSFVCVHEKWMLPTSKKKATLIGEPER